MERNPAVTLSEPSAEGPTAGPATVRYCSNCETDVEPGGKGYCPICGRFLPDNVVALVHGGRRMSLPPERESRRLELRAKVWADLGGNLPPIIAEVAEDFVSACVLRDQIVEHLEAIGPLTQRGTRRAAMDLYLATGARIERLSAMLGAFRGEVKTRPRITLPGVERMPSSALNLLQGLYSRLMGGESLSERELGTFDTLRSIARGQIRVEEPDGTTTQVESRTDAIGKGSAELDQPSQKQFDTPRH